MILTSDEHSGRKLYRVGEWVQPGTYENVESRRRVRLDNKDMLPASLDGRVAYYVRVQTWDAAIQGNE